MTSTHISALPVELLCKILRHAFKVTKAELRLEFSITFACVCRYWKAVAYQYPVIWTTIRIYLFRQTNFERLEAVLRRSQEDKLDIKIYEYKFRIDRQEPSRVDNARRVMTALIPHIKRCRSFRLRLNLEESLTALDMWKGLAVKFESLETLSVNMLPTTMDYTSSILNVFATPNLQTLEFRGIGPLKWNIMQSLFPSIGSLTVRGRACFCHSDWLETLQSLQPLHKLRRVDFHGPFPEALHPDHLNARVCLPMLEKLYITKVHIDSLMELVHIIEAPSLTALTISDPIDCLPQPGGQFSFDFQDHFHSLQMITLDIAGEGIDMFRELAATFQSVRCLVLKVSDAMPYLLELGIQGEDGKWILPRLISLDIDDFGGDFLHGIDPIQSMLERRLGTNVSQEGGPEAGRLLPIEELNVHIYQYELSPLERAWFEERLRVFSWTTHAPHYCSGTWCLKLENRSL